MTLLLDNNYKFNKPLQKPLLLMSSDELIAALGHMYKNFKLYETFSIDQLIPKKKLALNIPKTEEVNINDIWNKESGTDLEKWNAIINAENAANGGQSNKMSFGHVGRFSNYAGTIGDTLNTIFPTRTEYSGTYGDTAKQLNDVYDVTASTVSNFGPYGALIGGIMKAGAGLNGVVNKIGGGTDGMTRTDAWLNSNFLGLTPIGLINGFGGSKSHDYTRDVQIDADTMGSYNGFLEDEADAINKAGKKYGAFSRSERHKANNMIDNVSMLQAQLANIESANKLNLQSALGNTPFLSAGIQTNNSGGIRAALVGKQGLKFARDVIKKCKLGSPTSREYITVFEASTRKYVKIPVRLSKEQQEGMSSIQTEDGKSVYINSNNSVIFSDARDIKKARLHKDGGDINVIPEGALHKNKHHLDNVDEKFEEVTEKGIPVITEENGEIVQHAEVEKEEIIFRLEVTKKIEELSKKGTDEAAIEAGKLIAYEILHNTDDRADIIDSLKNGGTI